MDINQKEAISGINHKKALVFFVRKKLFKPVYLGKIKKFTGYQTFMWFKSKGYESFDMDIKMIEGEATIILVQKDQYHVLSENDSNKTINLEIEKGWFKLRIIGDSTSLNFTIKRYSK